MIVLDAGVLIGFLDSADAHHEAAVKILERNPFGYLVHPLTAAEVLVGPAKRGVEDEVWRDLRGIGVEVAELGPEGPLALARLRARWGLKMPDTCVLATAEQFDVHLATFDRQLATVATRTARLLPDG
ncbi:PIN domain-containing protein [Herbiconiux sp. KACC 21604]|uniref:type II toxin-antitoxin system VapC family toxin n=1 Tax=unclassified Herbiconiux TaxID=2618217 RepID=UPI0014926F06|nr:PIN domain-containing protein [Herbiconiux sp. SALV-R1]QJU54819.1 type II toxin-antitoxin system VapC family toxin [Herbiconiux sp. SALV-R1]WPO85935.1 PIN domain-containing protein [Herbiconiux sp. KACC 21604]